MASISANHYVLAVHDLRGAADWLIKVLGFAIYNEPPGWIFVKRDNCMIMLGECPDSLPAAQLGDHSWFAYLVVDDVELFHQRALDAAEPLHMKLETKPWGMREFGLKMPEGHRIMVGQAV